LIEMGEHDTRAERSAAMGRAAEFLPRNPEFPDRRHVVAIALSMLWLVGVAAHGGQETPSTAESSVWSYVVMVDESHSAGPALQFAFHKIVAEGIGGNAAAQVLKRLGEYVDSEVAQRGRATLSIGLIVDTVGAAKAARWSPEEMARLVIATHRKFVPERPQDWPTLQRAVERVRHGSRADEIIATDDTLREVTPPR
jgi:hypothetical protein